MTRVPATRWWECSARPRSSTGRSGSTQTLSPWTSGALAVVPLVTDVQDGVVVELHREVVPHAAHHIRPLPDAVPLGFPHRPDAPGAVAAALAPIGGDGVLGPGHREGARPESRLGQTLGVEDHPSLGCAGTGGARAWPGMCPSHVTSMATSCSVGSTTTRRRRSGSSTSMWNGPTERSARSFSGFDARTMCCAVAHAARR